MAISDLTTIVRARFDGLSPQARKAAGYLLDHPHDVAVMSMRELAREAKVTPATLVRLAQALDFRGYGEVKDHFVESLRDGDVSSFAARARRMQEGGETADRGGPEALGKQQCDIVALAVSGNGTAAIDRFARGLLDSNQVHIFGSRSSFAPMYQYYYLYKLFRQNAVLVSDPGGAQGDMLRHLRPGDSFLLASFAPYARESVLWARGARDAGARVFAILDSRVSPIAACANEVLCVPTSTTSFFPSLVGFNAMLEIVLARQVVLAGDAALQELEAAELQLAALGAYWNDGTTP